MGLIMKYLKSLFLSLKEIFIVMLIQYSILIIVSVFFNMNVFIYSFIILLFDILFIFSKKKLLNISFKNKSSYLPYFMLGISISIIYNMILYYFDLYTYEDSDISLFLVILMSGIIGPIFEEVLFRVSFFDRLEKNFSNKFFVIFFTSFIFAICHSGFTSLIIAFIIGVINGFIYYKDRDAIMIFTIHISLNLMSSFLYEFNFIILILGFLLFILSSTIVLKKGKSFT